jgi:predicted HTH domain antitoxin
VQITVTLPDEMAARLLAGEDPARTALEALAIEAYRQRRITGYQLRTLLGVSSRYELESFLKRHEVYDYTVEDFEDDLATIRDLAERREAKPSV